MNFNHKYFFLYTWIFWTLIFLLFSGFELIKHHGQLSNNLIYWPGAYFLSIALLTPMVVLVLKNTLNNNHFILFHFPLGLAFGFLHQWLYGIIILLGERLLNLSEHYSIQSLLLFYKNEWFIALEGLVWYFFIIVALLFLHYRNLYFQKEQDLATVEKLLSESSLESMTSRLNPHFLFNAMNNINMLIRKKENNKAINMSNSLSNLLRRSISTEKSSTAKLNDELSFLEEYINLEMLRYENVDVQLSISNEVSNPIIPQMLLQPLFENAFKHGVYEDQKGSLIKLSISKSNDNLIISLYNSGIFDPTWNVNNKRGIGLHHTIHRLSQLYNTSFTFKIQEAREGVTFKITIPYEE